MRSFFIPEILFKIAEISVWREDRAKNTTKMGEGVRGKQRPNLTRSTENPSFDLNIKSFNL